MNSGLTTYYLYLNNFVYNFGKSANAKANVLKKINKNKGQGEKKYKIPKTYVNNTNTHNREAKYIALLI